MLINKKNIPSQNFSVVGIGASAGDLEAFSKMPVIKVIDNMSIHTNNVYMIPQNYKMTHENGVLSLF